jgi:hypothetical protein
MKMKKIVIALALFGLTACSASKIDINQDEAIKIIVQAHNAVVAKLEQLAKATEQSLPEKNAAKFRSELQKPVPTPEAVVEGENK